MFNYRDFGIADTESDSHPRCLLSRRTMGPLDMARLRRIRVDYEVESSPQS